MTNNHKVLLSLNDVKMHFPVKKSLSFSRNTKFIKALDGVTLDIYENEIFGLVGESGCGKSTLGKVILNLLKKTSGSVSYNEIDLSSISKEKMRKLRLELQIIFQDPYSSLNPRLPVSKIISEALVSHKIYKNGSKDLENHTLKIMEKCGLSPYMSSRYPHQFSGGQRQRIGIARALALNPKFVVCDECVSTLDVSIQSQIINLLLDLKESENLTYLFISHDLSVVRFVSDRIGVMYLGNLVELGSSDDIFENPHHPYTIALLDAIPSIDKEQTGEFSTICGDVPSSIDPPSGCKFHPRCKFSKEKCKTDTPIWQEHSENHFVACHFPR